MTALRGIRGAILAPFYLFVPTVVGLAASAATGLIAGRLAGISFAEMLAFREDLLGFLFDALMVTVGGLSVGLAGGALSLQGARPAIATDEAGSWIGRATRALMIAAVGGVAATLLVLGLRREVGEWAAILLDVVLFVAAVVWAIAAVIPDFRGEEAEGMRGAEAGAPGLPPRE